MREPNHHIRPIKENSNDKNKIIYDTSNKHGDILFIKHDLKIYVDVTVSKILLLIYLVHYNKH